MIRIGVFNGSGNRDKPQPIIIKSEGPPPDPNIVRFVVSNQDKPKGKNS